MKRIFAMLLGATVIAAPLAQAQAQSFRHEPPRHEMRDDRRSPNFRRPPAPQVKRWQRGERLHSGVSRQRLDRRDFRRHGLREPRRGEQWVRVNNQYLLITAATGAILSIVGAR